MAAVAVEIAVQDPAGARIARDAGATRIELCAGLSATGGLTPSAATIAQCAQILETHVLIRTRPGGFRYTDAEIAVMADDIARAVELGAHGVVIGAALADNSLDTAALRRLIAAAGDAQVTLHRVFDTVPDRYHALRVAQDLGITRILTSGGFPKAPQGATELAALVAASNGIQIMAGGGITPETVDVLKTTGVHAVHGSCSTFIDCGPTGPGGGADDPVQVTDAEAVRALVENIARW